SRFRKISAHEHFKAGGDMDMYFRVAEELGIEQAVFVPTGGGQDNKGYQRHMEELLAVQKRFPGRVIAFATVDEADPNAPVVFRQAVEAGARGLKLIGGHPNFYDTPLDNPQMREVYRLAEEKGLPLLIHASLAKFPSQKEELERILRDFPALVVVAAHYAKTAPRLENAQALLDRYPNLFLDLSMGGGLPRYLKEITMEPRKFRDFIIRNQDRLLWGTDIILTRKTEEPFLRRRMQVDMNLFERPWYLEERASSEPLPGLRLPPAVLEKIYYSNPKRILKIK
ncbi:MAG: amidohydrolase, partial [Candidatus Omnitrophica bacterium]|nr:amidohydrolase [Candidatus Omnitrophota bacterium]